MRQLGCTGMQDLLALIEENKSASKIFILCSGETDEAGQSWCPDCVKAEPVIEKVVQKNEDATAVFIICNVGDRPTWKNPDNEFRKHADFQLKGIPTLLKYKSKQRIGPDNCSNKECVEMLFEEE